MLKNRFSILSKLASNMDTDESGHEQSDQDMTIEFKTNYDNDSFDESATSGAESIVNITRNQGRRTHDYKKMVTFGKKEASNQKINIPKKKNSDKKKIDDDHHHDMYCAETQNLKISRMERELKAQEKDVNDAKKRYKTLKQEINSMSEEYETKLKYHAQKYTDLEEKHTDVLQMNINLQKELQASGELNSMLKAQIKSLEEQIDKNMISKPGNHEVVSIMDSNGRGIIPKLRDMMPEYNIENKIGIYNMGNLLHYLTNHCPRKRLLILMGTNDLGEKSGREIIGDILEIARLELPNVTFVSIPPQSRDKDDEIADVTNLERIKINKTLKKYFNYVELAEIEDDPEQFLKDGIHFTDRAAEIVAKCITDHFKDNANQHIQHEVVPVDKERIQERRKRSKTKRESIVIHKDILNHVIGRNKINLNWLCSRYNVTISYIHNTDEDTTTIIIEGNKKEDVDSVIGEIKEITERREKMNNIREQNKKIVCKNWKNNNCQFGDNCWFHHPQEQYRVQDHIQEDAYKHDDYQENRDTHQQNRDSYRQHSDSNQPKKHNTRYINARMSPYERRGVKHDNNSYNEDERRDNSHYHPHKREYSNKRYAGSSNSWNSSHNKM